MKTITKVISSIVGIVGSLASVSILTACSSEPEDQIAVEYGVSPFAQCHETDDYDACYACCKNSREALTCVEDYVNNGICSEAAPDYGPQPTEKYGPLPPVYGPAPDYGPPEQ